MIKHLSIIKPIKRYDEFIEVVTAEAIECNTRNKYVWRKKKLLNVILISANLLCPEDLIKIGRIGIVE